MKPPDEHRLFDDLFGREADETDLLPELLKAAKQKRRLRRLRQTGVVFCALAAVVGLGLVAFRRTKASVASPSRVAGAVAGGGEHVPIVKHAGPPDPAAVSVAKIRTRRFNEVQKTEPVMPASKPKFSLRAPTPPKIALSGVPVTIVATEPFNDVVSTVEDIASVETAQKTVEVRTEGGQIASVDTEHRGYAEIGDEKLLSALAPHEAVLVRDRSGQQRLVFANPEDQKKLLGGNAL